MIFPQLCILHFDTEILHQNGFVRDTRASSVRLTGARGIAQRGGRQRPASVYPLHRFGAIPGVTGGLSFSLHHSVRNAPLKLVLNPQTEISECSNILNLFLRISAVRRLAPLTMRPNNSESLKSNWIFYGL